MRYPMREVRRTIESLVLAACWLLTGRALAAQMPAFPAADLDREVRMFTALVRHRYMEGTCRDTTYSGWEGFPLKACSYGVRDRRAGAKRATVVLLNPSPQQLARWVLSACLEVKHTTAVTCTRKLRRRIIAQSGAQFPIAGLVLEDMDGDGVWSMYAFRDGVTCVVQGVANGSTEVPTPFHLAQALGAPVTRVKVYARIAGTTREEYRKNGGVVDVGTSRNQKPAWRAVVRDLYQKAWRNDRNELLVAWARSNL